MRTRSSPSGSRPFRLVQSTFLLFGVGLLLFCLFVDWAGGLRLLGIPVNKLYGQRGQADVTLFRILGTMIALAILAAQGLLWRYPESLVNFAKRLDKLRVATFSWPEAIALPLAGIILLKTVIQLGLYCLGYQAYAGDDFPRSLRADYWYQHIPHLLWKEWLNLEDPWLPFPNLIFSLGYMLYRDVYLTPKLMNLCLSGGAVLVVYLLGRELFGRTAGLLTAALFAFQPWVVWLGISGMTSDIPSTILIALFGYCLARWLKTDRRTMLFAAAGCLFGASGMRYENWSFAVVFSCFLAAVGIQRWRRGTLHRPILLGFVGAIALADIFPLVHMAASYMQTGQWVAAVHRTDSFAAVPVTKINLLALLLYAFPLELVAAVPGIVTLVKARSASGQFRRTYLLVVALTFGFFAAILRGRLPVHGAGPARILLPYLVLVLPCAGWFFARLLRVSVVLRSQHIVLATSLLWVSIGIYDILRVTNYPTSLNVDAFYSGQTLRALLDLGTITLDGDVLLEKEEKMFVPHPIMVLSNMPERFWILANETITYPCHLGSEIENCRTFSQKDGFRLVILSTRERVEDFRKTFRGRSWQVGRYHMFETAPTDVYSAALARQS